VRERHEALVQDREAADPGVEDGDRKLSPSARHHADVRTAPGAP